MKNRIDEVYTIGKMMKVLGSELKKTGIEFRHFTERKSLSQFILSKDFSDTVILVKGSRGMKMEDFVEVIKVKII
jgi:UDP-N-acetylmuramoyl-tripeptide--D-alanyl-D-alanine ligase